MKIVYIAHPIGGDVEGNLKKLQEIYEYLSFQYDGEIVPFIPYYATVNSLDDRSPDARMMGMRHNKEFFKRNIIDEMWLYGPKVSSGMALEIEWCREYGINIVNKSLDIRTW